MLARDYVNSTENQETFSDGSCLTNFGQFFEESIKRQSAFSPVETEKHQVESVAAECIEATEFFRNLVEVGTPSAYGRRKRIASLNVFDRQYVLDDAKCVVFDEFEIDPDLSWIKAFAIGISREANQQEIEFLHSKINEMMNDGNFSKVNKAMEQIVKSRMSYEIIVGVVRFTRKVRREIQDWHEYANLASRRLDALGLNPSELLGPLD